MYYSFLIPLFDFSLLPFYFFFFFFWTFVSCLLRAEVLIFKDKWIINTLITCDWEQPGSHRSAWKSPKKGRFTGVCQGCWVCAGGRIGPGSVCCSVFQHRRWNSNLLSAILAKQMESTLLVNLQGKGFWEQALHMSFPPWIFACLGKQQWSHSLLLEGSWCGVPTPAVEMDKKLPKASTVNMGNAWQKWE